MSGWSAWGGGGTTTQGGGMDVLGGKGILVGDGESAVARQFDNWGPDRWVEPAGLKGNFRRTTVSPELREVGWSTSDIVTGARATINAQSSSAVQMFLIPGMDECEVYEIVTSDWSAVPSATLQGGVYAAPPVSGVIQAGAAILPATTQYNTATVAASAYAPVPTLPFVHPAIIRAKRELIGLWWCPLVVSPTPLTFTISVRGLPKWQEI